ncbi:LOW QUALITY PROTEIN: probable F-box protein At2g36090 [Durio zibethinus]|uniref:LOW QUALITY PROTEIN: probable F-box protein At2g36090 n=1 Tax=Durio zibethinus TaxID=66656 RepID=A0A6P6ALS0_DURZI|nr:LOW QUALITY PROTEIN: probable F-box protein At2g36090 [Durio zibethinus]
MEKLTNFLHSYINLKLQIIRPKHRKNPLFSKHINANTMAGSSTSPLQPALCTPDITNVDQNIAAAISTVHPDIIETHILTRLDGPTLASASCASTHFRALASQENLWTNICHSTWPSTSSPRVQHVISNSSNGSRSFFSDAFALTTDPASFENSSENPDLPSELISAVDIYYKKELIFSKVIETETLSAWFKCSPFRVDLLDPKEAVSTRIAHPDTADTCRDLEEDMELSWIVIDPIGKRAMNLSSQRPVNVHRHWLSGEVQVKFASVVAGGKSGAATELVQCGVVVTCGESVRGEMHVREVSLQVEDMDGMFMNGRDSLVILKRGLEGKRGKGKLREERRKNEVAEFLERKRERKERKMRREGALEMLCVAFGVLAVASSGLFLFLR